MNPSMSFKNFFLDPPWFEDISEIINGPFFECVVKDYIFINFYIHVKNMYYYYYILTKYKFLFIIKSKLKLYV